MSAAPRNPAVSGSFYPSDGKDLESMISSYLALAKESDLPKAEKIIGVVVPHAGYIYSGQTAAYSYAALSGVSADRYVIIGPNHRSYPPYTAVFAEGEWKTPLGVASVDSKTARGILKKGQSINQDESAHAKEHSVEVQVPFLQHLKGSSFTFTPIVMGDQSVELAEGLASSILSLKELPLVIASSDLTHYEPLETAKRKDSLLINAITSLDLNKFYRTLMDNMITACGYGAIATLMRITSELGGEIRLLHYSTSFETSGDSASVVGYSSLLAYKA